MAASYKKLFKLLIDRDMKKKELAEKAGISIATITKMGKDGAVVSSDVLVKICSALGCTIDDILEIIILANPVQGITSPCGACRQVISELMNMDAKVTMINLKKEVFECTVKDLIPFAFTSGDLHE